MTGEEARDLLRIVVGTMIPESSECNVPGADDPTIFASILARCEGRHQRIAEGLKALDELARERHGRAFSSVDFENRVELLNDLRPSVRRIAAIAVQCYYLDDRVMASLGMESRAPYPNGFDVPEGDWSLLEPVKDRQKLYRDVP